MKTLDTVYFKLDKANSSPDSVSFALDKTNSSPDSVSFALDKTNSSDNSNTQYVQHGQGEHSFLPELER
ncbi:hypothetical protein ACN4EE_23545 [Geminocystis sp. CENA526]|uniref:hypothetical protein n=1 Tax=Geminocystis sp. CENA526 TaxID=1355871 RepID=UPI003D6E8C91